MSVLQSLSPEQLAQLRTELNAMDLGDGTGRSPIRPRQLTDLRLQPRADDPRPHFEWSADSPRNVSLGPGTEYPKLMWHQTTGKEITVRSAAEQRQMADVYQLTPPNQAPLDPAERARLEFEALPEEERQIVLDLQRKARIERVHALLNTLPETQFAAVTDLPKVKKPKAS